MAFLKAVNGSSVYNNDMQYGFYRVTDGPSDHGCWTNTDDENPWLMIDLVNLYQVVRVTLKNIFYHGSQFYIMSSVQNIARKICTL